MESKQALLHVLTKGVDARIEKTVRELNEDPRIEKHLTANPALKHVLRFCIFSGTSERKLNQDNTLKKTTISHINGCYSKSLKSSAYFYATCN